MFCHYQIIISPYKIQGTGAIYKTFSGSGLQYETCPHLQIYKAQILTVILKMKKSFKKEILLYIKLLILAMKISPSLLQMLKYSSLEHLYWLVLGLEPHHAKQLI